MIGRIKAWAGSFDTVAGFRKAAAELADGELIENAGITGIDMGTGETALRLDMAPDLYYRIVTEMMGTQVNDDSEFFGLLREFAAAKQEYDKLKGAISQVENGGYGIVQPRLSEMTIEEPEAVSYTHLEREKRDAARHLQEQAVGGLRSIVHTGDGVQEQ